MDKMISEHAVKLASSMMTARWIGYYQCMINDICLSVEYIPIKNQGFVIKGYCSLGNLLMSSRHIVPFCSVDVTDIQNSILPWLEEAIKIITERWENLNAKMV